MGKRRQRGDLIVLSAKRLEKMLARQGCDDAGIVARAVLTARDAEQPIVLIAASGSDLPEKVPADGLEYEICCE